jgi:hypothetical protein
MKRLYGIVLLVLVALVGYFIYQRYAAQQTTTGLSTSSLSAAETAEITRLTTSCISWYVKEYASLRPPAAVGTEDTQTKSCFTSSFINSWAKNQSGVDPVIFAQDYYESWLTATESRILNASASEVAVLVTMGTDQEAQPVLLRVIRERGAWKIDAARMP